MWKNLFKYLLIAMFASFVAIGCGDDDDDDGGVGGTSPSDISTITVSGTVDTTEASIPGSSTLGATLSQAEPGGVVVYNPEDGTELATATINENGYFEAEIAKPDSNQFALLFVAGEFRNLAFFDLTSNPGNLVGNTATAYITIDRYSTYIANEVLQGNNKFPEGAEFDTMLAKYEEAGGVAFSIEFGNLNITGWVGGEETAGEYTATQVSVMEDGHQAVYNSTVDTNFAAKIIRVFPNSDNTTTVTFSVTKNGKPYSNGFADWASNGDWDPFQLIWTSYDNGSFSRYSDFSFGPDIIVNNGGGTYTFNFKPAVEIKPNMTFYLVGAKASGYANHDWLGVEEYINAVYVEGEIPPVDASAEGCDKCHSTDVLKHNAISIRPIDQDGKERPFFSCQSCHNNGRKAFHHVDIDEDGEMDSADLRNTIHWWHDQFHYPQSLSNCVTCHSKENGTLDKVVSEAFKDYDTCMTCHGDLVNKYGSHFDINHTGWEDRDCYYCHEEANIGPSYAEIHNGGYSFEKFDSDGTRWSEKVKFQIDNITYDNTTDNLTVKWGAYVDGSLLDLSDNSTYDFDTDNLTNETGAYVLVGYLGNGTNDVVDYAMATTTINDDGTATSTLTLDNATLQLYDVKAVKIGVLGVPAVDGGTGDDEDGIHIAVTSVTTNYDLENGDELEVGLTVSKEKCDSCHNELIIHDSGSHRHGAVGNPDSCMFCHKPSSAAGHYNEQSRSLDTYLHALHEGQPAPDGNQIHYPQSMANCESCHDSLNFPSMSTDLPVTLSGYKLRPDRKTRALADPVYFTGPQAAACGGCHKAYPIKRYFGILMDGFNGDTDNGTAVSEFLFGEGWNTFYNSSGWETSSFNNHVATMGFYLDNSTKQYVDVLTEVDSGAILGESCATCHTP